MMLRLKVIRKLEVSRRATIIVTLVSYIASPLVVLAVLAAAGKSPAIALDALYRGSIGTIPGFAQSIVQATSLMLLAVGLVIAFRAKVWNIGAEGQQIFGAILVTWFTLPLLKNPWPSYIAIPIALLLSFIGGGLFAAIPALMRSRLGINEVITTIMMNYVAIDALNWLVRGPFQDRSIPGSYPESPIFPQQFSLPIIFRQSSVTIGIVISVTSCILVYYLLFRTPLGYSIRAVGLNPAAAKTSGIPVKRVVDSAMILSGAFAGLGGGVYILGIAHALLPEQASGIGYTAVVVSLLGNVHPLGVIFASIFFGGLISGMSSVERALQIPQTLSLLSQGVIIVIILIIQVFARYGLKRT
jgi:general nucleoside transport system permease protein